MNRLLTIAFALLVLVMPDLYAQSTPETIQAEIDQTVWKAFKRAFETLDGDALNSIYADQVLRVTPQGIDTENAFRIHNSTRFQANQKNGDRISLDFWFDSRKTNRTTSYEVGFFRIGVISRSGSTSYHYGQFHIVLKKVDGHWKIVQDWDTTSIGGKQIAASDFERGQPLQF